ncbi:MAG TPA: DUF222 domain-containing protein [Methylomirabilota bacterium]|nr:DUF222 domain-containing protein [Methylomirabilota bacterium]
MSIHPSDGPAPLQPSQPAPPHLAELDRLGDQIAELSAHLEAATARLLALIREFDARGGWSNGFRSCAEWLAWRVGLDPGAARERVRVARALETLPALADALARGELSYAKVRALTRIATPETEARLLAVGRAGTAAHIESIVRGWRRLDRQAEAREATRQHAGRALHVHQDEDSTVVLHGRLTPEVGTLLLRALDAARETLYQRRRATETSTWPQQQADALALLAETALHHELDPGAPGERYQVVVHVDAAVLADPAKPGQSVLEEGPRVSAETSQRLACDASRVVMRHDADGRVVEVGARTRTIPPALRRALQHRDRSCRFPGCNVRIAEGHHVRHWAHGGRRSSRTSRYSAAGITGRCTRRATRSSVAPPGPSSSDGLTAGRCLMYRRRRPCPPIPRERSGHRTPRRDSICMRGQGSPSGSESGWTCAGRSTCYIRGPRENVETRKRE